MPARNRTERRAAKAILRRPKDFEEITALAIADARKQYPDLTDEQVSAIAAKLRHEYLTKPKP